MKISIQGYEVNFDQPSLYWLDDTLKTRFGILAETLADNHLNTPTDTRAASETIKELKSVIDLRMALAVDRLADLRLRISKEKTLEVEVQTDGDTLKEVIGEPFLIHLLDLKMPYLKAKGVRLGRPVIREIGLYSLTVVVEGGEVEVRLWVLPAPDAPKGDSNLELAS